MQMCTYFIPWHLLIKLFESRHAGGVTWACGSILSHICSHFLFAFPFSKTSLLKARNEAINSFQLSGYFMLPEVHHGEQQKQGKNSYYFNSLIQADVREYLKHCMSLNMARFQKGCKARIICELLKSSSVRCFLVFWWVFFSLNGLW